MRPSFTYHPSCSSLYLSLDMFFFFILPILSFCFPGELHFSTCHLVFDREPTSNFGGRGKKKYSALKCGVCAYVCVCKTVILRQIKERLVTLMTAELQRERRKSLKDSD